VGVHAYKVPFKYTRRFIYRGRTFFCCLTETNKKAMEKYPKTSKVPYDWVALRHFGNLLTICPKAEIQCKSELSWDIATFSLVWLFSIPLQTTASLLVQAVFCKVERALLRPIPVTNVSSIDSQLLRLWVDFQYLKIQFILNVTSTAQTQRYSHQACTDWESNINLKVLCCHR
jgi:hypothetical protein